MLGPFSGFHGKGGLAAVTGDRTLVELAQQLDIQTNQITAWTAQLLEGAAAVFGSEPHSEHPGPRREGHVPARSLIA